jgi:Protein of unknown function with PCYCGC motif
MRFNAVLLANSIVLCGFALVGATLAQNPTAPQLPHLHAYHDAPSPEPLPETLDPSNFLENHAAFVVYSLASKVKQTLYQVPCYCPCDRRQGHTSLLDCYRDRHGVACPTCQKELLYCFRQAQKHKTPQQIRSDIARGRASKIDVSKLTERMYPHLRAEQTKALDPRERHPRGKEVKQMKYEKPQIVLSVPAADTIQARKGIPVLDSDCNGGSGHTACAYQADE